MVRLILHASCVTLHPSNVSSFNAHASLFHRDRQKKESVDSLDRVKEIKDCCKISCPWLCGGFSHSSLFRYVQLLSVPIALRLVPLCFVISYPSAFHDLCYFIGQQCMFFILQIQIRQYLPASGLVVQHCFHRSQSGHESACLSANSPDERT